MFQTLKERMFFKRGLFNNTGSALSARPAASGRANNLPRGIQAEKREGGFVFIRPTPAGERK